jgi:uncharacterized protein
LFKLLRLPLLLTATALIGAGIVGGFGIALTVGILAILEISLSFDNAVVNATVLQRMDERWQRLFLTLGILIAVFGMRLLFPLLVVGIAGHLSPGKVIQLALQHPDEYAEHLTRAHPAIAAFGGVFLLMIFLDFMLDEARDVVWFARLEQPFARIGKLDQVSVIITAVGLLLVAVVFAPEAQGQVLVSGLAGLATYLAVNGLTELFEAGGSDRRRGDDAEETSTDEPAIRVPASLAHAGLFAFLYLEVLDASFSFDGVVGAFAISDQVFVIALGLGIGAMYIRSLTVFLVREGTLAEYIHLEHGAHYAIGALAVVLFVGIRYEVPEFVTGVLGAGLIGLALITSIVHRRREGAKAFNASRLPHAARTR